MRSILLTFVFSLLCLGGLRAQNPGGVEGAVAWLTTDTVSVHPTYPWKDLSGHGITVAFPSSGASSPPDSTSWHTRQSEAFNFHPALYFSKRSLQVDLSAGDGLRECMLLGVFALPSWEPSQPLLQWNDDTFRVTPRQLVTPRHSLEYTPASCPPAVPAVLAFAHAAVPHHSVWDASETTTLTFAPYPDSLASDRFYLPELLVFSRLLTPLERRQAESYLALKYGITLDGSYYDSHGNLLWDADANHAFGHHIAGIVSDTTNLFVQPRSVSTATPMPLVTIGVADGMDMPDGSYLLWGDDSLPTTARPHAADDSPWHVLPRQWKTSTAGMVPTVVSLSCLADSVAVFLKHANNGVFLLMEPDGNEAVSPETALQMKCSRADDDTIYFDSVCWDSDMSHADRFTFAYYDGLQTAVTPCQSSCVAGGDDGKDGRCTIRVTRGAPSYAYRLTALDVNAYSTGTLVRQKDYLTDTLFTIENLPTGTYRLLIYRRGSDNVSIQNITDNNINEYRLSIGTECAPDMMPNEAVLVSGPGLSPAPRRLPPTSGITPSDTSGGLYVQAQASSLSYAATLPATDGRNAQLLVYDAVGRLLLRSDFSASGSAATAPFAVPRPGVYIIKALTPTSEHTVKLTAH